MAAIQRSLPQSTPRDNQCVTNGSWAASLHREISSYHESLKKLPEADTKKFVDTLNRADATSLTKYLDGLNKEQSKVHTKSIEKLTRIFESLQFAAKITNATPDGLDVLFGIIQCTIGIGHKIFKGSRLVAEKLEQMALWTTDLVVDDLDIIPKWSAWDNLAQLSILIVRFCCRVICCRSMEEAEQIHHPFLELEKLCKDCKKQAEKIKAEKDLQKQENELREKETEAEKKKASDEIEFLKSWLANHCSGISTNSHSTNASYRAKGTGQWFIDKTTSWLTGKKYPVYWAEGNPGMGKSVLASNFIEHTTTLLNESTGTGEPNNSATNREGHGSAGCSPVVTALAYIYFAYDEQNNQSPLSTYAYLLRQLLPSVPSLSKKLRKIHSEAVGPSRKQNNDPLEDILRGVLKEMSSTVVLVFDALDETDSRMREHLCEFLRSLSALAPRVLIFSRPGVHQSVGEMSHDFIKRHVIQANGEDMSAAVSAKLNDSKALTRIVRRTEGKRMNRWIEKAVADILKNAGGWFTYAMFRAREVCEQKTVEGMEGAIRKRDADPNTIYTRTWKRITSVSEANETCARRIIGWLTFAKTTLDANELTEALAIKPGVYTMKRKSKVFPEEMEEICHGLVIFDTKSRPKRLRLAHQTVREHFSAMEEFQAMKTEMCNACFTYLTLISVPKRRRRMDSDSQSLDSSASIQFRSGSEISWQRTLRRSATANFGSDSDNSNSDNSDSNGDEECSTGDSGDTDSLTESEIGQDDEEDQKDDYVDDDTFWLEETFWPQSLTRWVVSNNTLSRYAERYAVAHLQEAVYGSTVEDILVKFVERMFPTNRVNSFGPGNLPASRRPFGMEMSHLATFLGKRGLLARVLNIPHVTIDAPDSMGRTALMWALCLDKGELARLLLDKKAQVNLVDKDGDITLCYASGIFDEKILQELISQTDPEAINWKVLHSAINDNNATLVQMLLDRQIDPNYKHPEDQRTGLHEAIQQGHSELIPVLLKGGAKISIPDADGNTPLVYAIMYNRIDEFNLLLGDGVIESCTPNLNQATLLHFAAERSPQMVKKLITAGANPAAQDKDGDTPLFWALNSYECSEKDVLKIIKQLVANPDTIAVSNKRGMTAWHVAAQGSRSSVVKCLLQYSNGAEIGISNAAGETPLQIATREGNTEIANLLLDCPLNDIIPQPTASPTLLHSAIKKCQSTLAIRLARMLPALINQQNSFGQTPLFEAVHQNQLDTFKFLLAHGADPSIHPQGEDNIFFAACMTNNEVMVEELIGQEGRWEFYRDKWRNTSLHKAAQCSSVQIVTRILTLQGLSVQDCNLSGDTPIHVVIRDGDPAIVEKSLQAFLQRVDNAINMRNNAGKTALDFALERSNSHAIELLLKHQASAGLEWVEEFEVIQRWSSKPWFPALREALKLGQVSPQSAPLLVDSAWSRDCVRIRKEIYIDEDTPEEAYAEIMVPCTVRSPVRRIVFKILSHDQGWSDEVGRHPEWQGTSKGSWTWFEAGVLGPDRNPRGPRRTIQRNDHAVEEFRLHFNSWDFRDATPGLREWLLSVQGGDTIQVFPKALFACWVNTVKEVEIQLYCEQVGETARSHYIATSEIDHHESSELREYAPRIICYHQTHHKNDGQHISLRPLVSENTGVTHVIIAAIHLNESYGDITLNNDSTSSPKFDSLWKDIKYLQASGIKILAMLGGAAPGSFTKLDGSDENFEFYYEPLLDVLRNQHFDGIDLDVEENMSLEGIIRLIDRLRTDLGSDFLITLAPVATALIGQPHLSGFDYETLENLRGNEISWYNTQFYCGWSKLPSMESYGEIAAKGWPMRKVVVGLSTNPSNATGYIDLQELENALLTWGLPSENKFGGFMGWEYFNSLPGGLQQPWQWASQVSTLVKKHFHAS